MGIAGNLVRETSVTTGTGSLTLTAVSGYPTFDAIFGHSSGADSLAYFVIDTANNAWEYGTGHMTSSTILSRDTVIGSSNANAKVNFLGGTIFVINDLPAQRQADLNAANTFLGINTFESDIILTNGLSNTTTIAPDGSASFGETNFQIDTDGNLTGWEAGGVYGPQWILTNDASLTLGNPSGDILGNVGNIQLWDGTDTLIASSIDGSNQGLNLYAYGNITLRASTGIVQTLYNLLDDGSGGMVIIGTFSSNNSVGFFGTSPAGQQTALGTTSGFTTNAGPNIVHDTSTFTGGSGSSAYTVGDVVLALKNYGLLAA